ncbi:hypothetical protein [Galbibacter mesophilus]|uniref:hypothetical protein n=1 Tax=Galbibacter mesophilus TaxID=379069 RepID=UPI00191FA3D3|nr:hypothetical protein [Galbibacter mesophilus]MCM5662801.1 hypothetical protein [Galbibacter mesophilus]
MKSIFTKKVLISVFLISSIANGQEKGLFPKNEFVLKGESTVIGNNILSIHASEPYNHIGYGAEKNDRLAMVYTDIDYDVETFSSSSAHLQLPISAENIVFAGLYWTATYPYEKGEMVKGNTEYLYSEEIKRIETYNQIKIKLPGDANYQSVKGEIIADKIDSIAKPYVCFADVTSLLKNKKNVNGEFTVANVRAAQGHLLGGSAAGWLLYLIYEDKNLPKKKFTLIHGCKPIVKGGYLYNIPSINKLPEPQSLAKITLGALEGDERLKTDELILMFNTNQKQHLHTKTREQRNFLNSSITLNDSILGQRKPNSQNTLGFDIASISFDYDEQSTAKSLSQINFNTVRDTYFLFFLAIEDFIAEE